MNNILNRHDLLSLFEKVKEDILDQTAAIGELDAACGDGDLGVTMELGLKAVAQGLPEMQDQDLGTCS